MSPILKEMLHLPWTVIVEPLAAVKVVSVSASGVRPSGGSLSKILLLSIETWAPVSHITRAGSLLVPLKWSVMAGLSSHSRLLGCE